MSKQQGKPGPSKPYGRPQKVVHKTIDLLKQNEQLSAKGKGKEKEVLGNVMGLVDEVKRLPGMISVEKFAQTRAMEIHAFQTAIKVAAAQSSTRAFQSLPRHLRRRAASHNPRRVPKRLRSRAAGEIVAGDNIAKKHRKIAKLRAKGNLRSRLKRTTIFRLRQRSKTWLPTHIWHAKRYHMSNLWGWRLPLTPTLKSFRPAYRAGRKKAIAWDVSYYGVVEVEGAREDILGLLSPVTGGKFAGEKFENGSCAARTMIYHPGSFPRGLIGPAEIIWCPSNSTSTDASRRIWIRLHPSIFSLVWDILKIASSRLHNATHRPGKSETSLQIKNLRGELEALEIMGPKSGEVLRRVFRLCNSETGEKSRFLNALGDPAEVSEGTVVGLNIYDPRLNFPPPRLQSEKVPFEDTDVLKSKTIQPSIELAHSALWDEKVREKASTVEYTKYQLDSRRHKLGIPGTRLYPTSSDNRLPILLIHRSTHPPPSPTSKSFHGFTILLPSSWTQYILNSIAYCSTIIGGLNERKVQHREAGAVSFPEYFGNVCPAGKEWEDVKGREEKEKWNRKPSAKRVVHDTLGTSRPWVPDWNLVMGQTSLTEEETALNGNALSHPYLVPYPFSAHLSADLTPVQLLKMYNTFRSHRSLPAISSSKADDFFNDAVLHVEVRVLGRGSPGDMAVICALTREERREWIKAFEKGVDEVVFAGETSRLQQLGESRGPEEKLLGWTTSGNISLTRGQGHAIGTITLSGYVELLKAGFGEERREWMGRDLVYVRNRDGKVGRFAELKVIS